MVTYEKSLLTLALAFGLVAAPFTTDILSSTAEAKPLPPRSAAREGLVPHQVRIDNEIDSISARFGIAESTVKNFITRAGALRNCATPLF